MDWEPDGRSVEEHTIMHDEENPLPPPSQMPEDDTTSNTGEVHSVTDPNMESLTHYISSK